MDTMNEIRSLAYTFLIGDLLHYGHLRLLQRAREVADYHVCGVVSDAAARETHSAIANFFCHGTRRTTKNACNLFRRENVEARAIDSDFNPVRRSRGRRAATTTTATAFREGL